MGPIVLLLALGGIAGAATCPIQDISLSASVDGTLAATDCRLRDIDATVRTTTYVQQFRVNVTEKGVLTVRESSTSFNTYLYLYNSEGRQVVSNDDAEGSTNSRIIVSLNPGRYVAVASSRILAVGAFKLAASFESPRTCTVPDIIAGQTVSGSLTATTCRTVDLRTGSTDDRPVDRYKLTLTARSVVTLDLQSTDFDTYLELWTASARITTNRGGGGGKNSRIVVSLEAGSYVVYAYPLNTATGAYTLKAGVESPRPCAIQDLTIGGAPSGRLSDQSCRILDVVSPSTNPRYVDQYRFTVAKRAVITLGMRSVEFNTLLILTDTSYETLFRSDDFDDPSTDATLYVSLDPGTYIVLAATADAGAAGVYASATKTEEPRACPVKEMGVPETVIGTLLPESCRVLDVLVPSEDATLLDTYRITIDKPGVLTIDMSSPEFAPYLFLVDTQYNSLYELDSEGDSAVTAQILVPPGTYYILANTDDFGGNYTLRTLVRNPRSCPPSTLALQDLQSGTLAADGCTFADIVPFQGYDGPTAQYQVTIPQRGDLTVKVDSTEFPPAILISDASMARFIAFDLNDAGSGSVEVTATLPAGQYNILVPTVGSQVGNFTIATRFGTLQ